MKKTLAFAFAFLCAASALFAGKTMLKDNVEASYYGAKYNGRPTSSGEIFDMYAMTCAHKTLPFGTMLEVVNLANGNSVVVRVNDRGPFVRDREIDLSYGAAERLGMITAGTARVSIAIVDENYALSNPSETRPAQNPGGGVAFADTSGITGAYTYTGASVEDDASTAASAESGGFWRIQLGSFTREENALRLVRSLRSIGLEPAYEKTEGVIRVVLPSVAGSSLEETKTLLADAGFWDYLLRREN